MNFKTSLFSTAILLTVFTACNKSGVVPAKGQDLVLTPIETQRVSADNAFALKLFKNLDSANTTANNLFASPLSVSFALGMTSNGSHGQTLAAIDNTMGFNGFTQDAVNSYYQKLITDLPKLDPNTTLKIANSIWYKQDFSVLPQFTQTNSSYYSAKIQPLDFSSSSAANTINSWVNTQTNGAIPSIINQVDAGDIMYLINTIYFKSIWNQKFDVSNTKALPFYLADNGTVQAPFMDGSINYNRYSDNEVTVAEIPYANGKYSMIVAIPASTESVQQLVTGLDSAKWKTWTSNLRTVNAEIKLPKFTFSYSIDLKNALSQLGMGNAFSDNADFSLINATTPLSITHVFHKAYVQVDETGTTATAATAVVTGTAVVLNPPVLVIDHPFVFAIRQMSSGLIMFMGTVNNPLQ